MAVEITGVNRSQQIREESQNDGSLAGRSVVPVKIRIDNPEDLIPAIKENEDHIRKKAQANRWNTTATRVAIFISAAGLLSGGMFLFATFLSPISIPAYVLLSIVWMGSIGGGNAWLLHHLQDKVHHIAFNKFLNQELKSIQKDMESNEAFQTFAKRHGTEQTLEDLVQTHRFFREKVKKEEERDHLDARVRLLDEKKGHFSVSVDRFLSRGDTPWIDMSYQSSAAEEAKK